MSTTNPETSPWYLSVPTIAYGAVIDAEPDTEKLLASYDGCVTESLATYDVLDRATGITTDHHIVSLDGERLSVGQVRYALRHGVRA